jgi:hypothetical protein
MARLSRRIAMISGLALAVGLGALPVAQAASGGTSLEPIGDPIWKPVDCHVFSAPVGTAETGYAEAFETFASLLPPPNHVAHPDLGIGPLTLADADGTAGESRRSLSSHPDESAAHTAGDAGLLPANHAARAGLNHCGQPTGPCRYRQVILPSNA